MANIYNNNLISAEKNKIQLSLCDLENKMTEEEQLNVLYKKLKDAEFDVTYEQLKGHINVYITNSNIMYIPKNSSLDIPIILFKSTIEHASGFSSDLIEKEKKLLSSKLNKEDYGWQDFTKQSVFIYEINCNHMQIFEEPYIKQIAKHLKKHL
jgi:thioesterase domain-containing protein